MTALRLIAWNCHHGSLSARLDELAPFAPAVVFLQECRPAGTPLSIAPCVTQTVNARKGIALASLSEHYRLARLRPRARRGRAYHAFHNVEHGYETHSTYRHNHKQSRPWHIDFCFVPADWVAHLVGVEILDGPEWAARSDHSPLKVDVHFGNDAVFPLSSSSSAALKPAASLSAGPVPQ